MTNDTPPGHDAAPTPVTWDGVRRGATGAASVALFLVPFGIAFGVAAAQKGLEPWLAALMSFLVCAGSSQFAALDLWTAPLPAALISLTVLAVNSRHLLYGAALYTWVRPVPARTLYATLFVLTDMSWAYTMQQRAKGEADFGVLAGSSVMLWAVWVTTSYAGAYFGAAIGNPRTWGLDVVMILFFATSLVGLWRGAGDLAPWVAAAVAALLSSAMLPAGWHVIVGALAGGIVGVLADEQ